MGRTARDNRDRPHPRPVQKIELTGGNVKQRLIAVVIVLVIGVVALAYAVNQLLTPDVGWQAIEASSADGATCADEFVFLYELGAAGGSVAAENRAVSALYTDACRKMYQLYHTMESFEGIVNLREINLHPNETLTVDEALYRAFETVQRYGDRTIYLGPVYARYNDLFNCLDDAQLVDFDPYLSDEVREEYGAVAAFASDSTAIDVCLLGDNQVCLSVSEEYLAYARRAGIERFLDFGWLTNAFVVDYLADVMAENGFTHGSISSYDGFSRNLDDRQVSYAQNVYDYEEGFFGSPLAVMQYEGPMAIIYLRDYPFNNVDSQRIYQLRTGELRTRYLDPADGLCKSAAHDLICYSATAGCGEIALQAAPIYVAETLDVQALEALAGHGTQSIRCADRAVWATDRSLTLTELYENEDVHNTASLG